MPTTTELTFEQAMERFEQDRKSADRKSPVGRSLASRDGWGFSVLSVATPPGQLIERHYHVDSHNYRIEVTERAGEPNGYTRELVLCLATSQII